METKRSSSEIESLIWPLESRTLSKQAYERLNSSYQASLSAFTTQLRKAKEKRQEKERRRQEARQKRLDRLAQEAKQKPRTEPCRLVNVEDAPEYLKRQYIHRGYLIGGTPGQAAWNTLFHLNNETLNAWTMVPACFVAVYSILLARQHLHSEVVAFWIFALSCLPHAPFSMGLHLTDGSSRAWRDIWRALDVFFIFTCGVPRAAAMAWFVFPDWQGYTIFMTIVLAVYSRSLFCVIVGGKIKTISKPALAKAVSSTVVCYSAPVFIAAVQEMQAGGCGVVSKLYFAILLTFVFSTLTYGCKYPERLLPGRFDFIGNGHQLMHVSASIEYCLEFAFLWHMAKQKVASERSIEEDDQIVDRLLGRIFT